MNRNCRLGGELVVILSLAAAVPLPAGAAVGDPPAPAPPAAPAGAGAVTATGSTPDETDAGPFAGAVRSSAAAGSFLPLTLSPTVGAVAATAVGYGGWDAARGTAVAQTFAEVRVWRQLALRGGAELGDTSHRMRPTIGARLQVLSQQRHGVDGSVSVLYRAEGFTEPEGEIEGVFGVGRRIGRTALIANLAYGQDPEGRERDGEVRLAALARIVDRLHLGLDGRWRFDLGSDTAKLQAANEPLYDVDVGPVAALTLGPVALVAHAGASVVRRVGQGAALGLIGLGGLGTSF